MAPAPNDPQPRGDVAHPTPLGLVLAAWAFVSAPLLWGVLQTLKKVAALFQ
jgi:hypothetical protein